MENQAMQRKAKQRKAMQRKAMQYSRFGHFQLFESKSSIRKSIAEKQERGSPSTEIPERQRKIRKSIAHKVKKTQYKFDVIHVERMLKVRRIDQDVRERMNSLQKECIRRSCQIGGKLDALADRMVKFHSIKVNSIEDLDAIDFVNRADYSKHIANRGQRWNVKVLMKTPEDLKTEDDDLEIEEEVKQAIERSKADQLEKGAHQRCLNVEFYV